MNIEELRNYCISKKHVEECFPFDEETLVFKVLGKVFLLSNIFSSPVQFNVKCNPELAIQLREKFNCVLGSNVVGSHVASNSCCRNWCTWFCCNSARSASDVHRWFC